MGEKRMSSLGRIGQASRDPDVAVEAPPQAMSEPAEARETRGMEAMAAAVALAIHRGRRGSRPMVPALKIAGSDRPDEWAMSGRLAQVDRSPARDPWNR